MSVEIGGINSDLSLRDKSEFEWLVVSDLWLVKVEILPDFFDTKD